MEQIIPTTGRGGNVAKPRVMTALRVWMVETGLTDGDLARRLNELVPQPGDKKMPLNERQIGRWRKGLAVPRYAEHLAALEKLSGGRVTASSFVEARLKEPPNASGSGAT